MCSQGGQHRPFHVAGAEGRQGSQDVGERLSAWTAAARTTVLPGCGLSLRDLRKSRVSFWFPDPCTLVRLHFCGKTIAPPSLWAPLQHRLQVGMVVSLCRAIWPRVEFCPLQPRSSLCCCPICILSSCHPWQYFGLKTLLWAAAGLVQPVALRLSSPTTTPREKNSRVGNAMTRTFSFLLLASSYLGLHTYILYMPRETRKGLWGKVG